MEIVCKVAYNRGPQLELKTAPETFLKSCNTGQEDGSQGRALAFSFKEESKKVIE